VPETAAVENSADLDAVEPPSSQILQEKDTALRARDTAQQRVEILEKELAALKSELDRYMSRVEQMERAWQDASMARDSITRHMERLMKSVTRNGR
jgi:chromosome segregation ATPase